MCCKAYHLWCFELNGTLQCSSLTCQKSNQMFIVLKIWKLAPKYGSFSTV